MIDIRVKIDPSFNTAHVVIHTDKKTELIEKIIYAIENCMETEFKNISAYSEDGTVVGGLGSAVAEWMTKHDRTNHLKMLGVQDEFVHQGTVAQLYERCGMDAKSLENAIIEMLENNK